MLIKIQENYKEKQKLQKFGGKPNFEMSIEILGKLQRKTQKFGGNPNNFILAWSYYCVFFLNFSYQPRLVILGVRLIYSRYEVGIYECFLDPGFVTKSSLGHFQGFGFKMANSKFGKRKNIARPNNLSLAKTSFKWVPTKSSKSSQNSTSFSQEKIDGYQPM